MIAIITWSMGLWVICHMALCDKQVLDNNILVAFLKAIKVIAVCGIIITLIALLFRH